ncbi:DUF2835 family protein [Neptunomonas concharum]|uniref:DUF2835 family protein n=1 Tax=Neptunomonas concharum TaxID=1031538 RepID=A0A5P1RAK7_9GAMM|nr:DUF2835 family protein [Neptunomonas concharum]QEQ96322.1 DUF2835 family protein [Neptunomonas concharum]
MNEIIINISISTKEYLKQYQAPNCQVSTLSSDGRRVRFPASILRPFLLHDGIKGRFRISFDSGGKFKSIQRIN